MVFRKKPSGILLENIRIVLLVSWVQWSGWVGLGLTISEMFRRAG